MTRLRQEQLVLPAQVESVHAARHFLSYVLDQWALQDLAETVELAASEVLSNAVVHARTPFQLEVRADEDLLVSVRDAAPAWSDTPHDVALPSWDAEHGRGLAIVAAVTDGWGVRPEGDGKTVWFRVRLLAPPSGPEVGAPA